jgi:pyruvate kinase
LINFGITPINHEPCGEEREILREDIMKALEHLDKLGFAQKGDLFIVLHGDYWAKETNTSTIKLICY